MFDLCCGYWQILVRESDKKYLAFTTESHGLMTFKRAPFGMLTSGNTFQRAIDLILEKDCNGRVLHNIASSYSDDGAVYSTTNDHIDDLTRVLKLLKKGGAVLGLKKCIWCTDEGKFCGFEVVCGRGIKADTEKIEALASMKS